MEKWKAKIDAWILDDLIEEAIIIGAKLLIKLIKMKFFFFIEDNNITFSNKKEEKETFNYFEKQYRKKYLNNVTKNK